MNNNKTVLLKKRFATFFSSGIKTLRTKMTSVVIETVYIA